VWRRAGPGILQARSSQYGCWEIAAGGRRDDSPAPAQSLITCRLQLSALDAYRDLCGRGSEDRNFKVWCAEGVEDVLHERDTPQWMPLSSSGE